MTLRSAYCCAHFDHRYKSDKEKNTKKTRILPKFSTNSTFLWPLDSVELMNTQIWWAQLTPSLRRPYIHANFFWPPVGQRVNTHFCRKPCQHATRGCDKRWMTCIHAGVSRSPSEHASVPPDKRHCRQWMSSLFCGFLPNPFIHDLFCWSSRHKFVKTDL